MIRAELYAIAGRLPQAEFDIDDDGYVTSKNPFMPPIWEFVFGLLATGIIVALIVWKAGPMIKKSFTDRTARIQDQLDSSAKAKAEATAEAERIRTAKGDIDAERQRLFAEADEQAEALLSEGRQRIEAEMVEIESRAAADIEAAASRSGDELRNEIARYSAAAVDEVVANTLDDATQQRLIEDFIARVGAGGTP